MKKIVQLIDQDKYIYPITTSTSIVDTTYNKTLHGNIRNLIVTPLTRGIVTLGEGYFNKTDSGYIVSECASLVPYAGVTINIKLPKDMSIQIIYGRMINQPTDNTSHSQDFESNILKDGDTFTFPEVWSWSRETWKSYGDLYRVKFMGNNINIPYILDCLNNGSISLTYENPYGNIIDNNADIEHYIRSIQVKSVNNYTIKYLPTFAHASDFHSDMVRLQNYLDYCDYLGLKVAVITGDFCSQTTSDGFSNYLEQFENHKVIPIICTGNHDKTTCYGKTNVPKYNEFFQKVATKYNYQVSDLSKDYYYLDVNIEDQNIRFIALDQYEVRTYGYNISEAQTRWFIDTLNSTPAGYKIFVLMHQKEVPVVKEINEITKVPKPNGQPPEIVIHNTTKIGNGTFYEETMAYDDSAKTEANKQRGDVLLHIIKLFQSKSKNTTPIKVTQPKNGESFTLGAEEIDFTSAQEEFVAFMSGHTHRDTIGINGENAESGEIIDNYLRGTTHTYQLHLNISANSTARYNLRDLPTNMGKSHKSDLFNIYSIEDNNINVVRVGASVSHESKVRLIDKIPYKQ